MSISLERRDFLRLAVAGLAGTMSLSACDEGTRRGARPDPEPRTRPTPTEGDRILLAYFSRAGENYWNGGRRNLRVGNTEVLAGMITERLGCDVHRIQPVDAYSDSYDETVTRNVLEQEADARPAMADPLPSIEQYDSVLLASPIWNVRAPVIMATFAERYDVTRKTVLPVTTFAMSGLGTTRDDYARLCRGARIGPGLAVRGERVRSSGEEIGAWIGTITGRAGATDRA